LICSNNVVFLLWYEKEDYIVGTDQRRKTTLLEQIQYQIKKMAVYSYYSNCCKNSCESYSYNKCYLIILFINHIKIRLL
jgi:hypothetical protein